MKIDFWTDWSSWIVGVEYMSQRYGSYAYCIYISLLIFKIDVSFS